jgi:TolB protein
VSPWRQKGADALAVGSLTRLADGRWDVRFRLWDVVRGQDQGGRATLVAVGDLRMAAHRIADFIYEKLTGEKGVFSTRISYVTKAGNRFNLWVADADGENAQSALASAEPIISPAWSANGGQLAYVSFESRKPVVYVHEVASGKRRLIANFRGSNSAPAWSPDGRTLAVTLHARRRLAALHDRRQRRRAAPPDASPPASTPSRCIRPTAAASIS